MIICLHAAPPQPFNITVTWVLTTAASESGVSINSEFEGLLHWDIQEDSDTMDFMLNTTYIITVTPESEELKFETSNTSTQLTLFLDQDYNISVTARNCVGTSKPAELVWNGEYIKSH